MGADKAAALRSVAGWRPDTAVVFGSGLESLPAGATVDDEFTYAELGWPCTAVPGHANRLRLVRAPAAGSAGLRLALACGRPHGYEGWSRAELERPVRDLVAAGTSRVLHQLVRRPSPRRSSGRHRGLRASRRSPGSTGRCSSAAVTRLQR
jgi:purine nucleoside phosphorylase